jgi:hypothetical protein
MHMEYLIRSGEPFEQLEARVVRALGRHDFAVHRSFSLHSATQGERGSGPEDGGGPPGFSVLWLYASGAGRRPLALVTLYQRQGHTMFRMVPAAVGDSPSDAPETADLRAELIAALVLDGLEICLGLHGCQGCVDAARVADDGTAEPDRSPR